MHGRDGIEYAFGVEALRLRDARDFRGKHVEEHFGVARRVDVTAIRFVEFLRKFGGVRQVAVVREHDPVGSVHVERLGFLVRARATLGRVTHLTDPDIAREVAHVARAKHVAHEPHGLVHVKVKSVERGNARRVLTAMLQEVQRIVDALVHRFPGHHGNDTAHSRDP